MRKTEIEFLIFRSDFLAIFGHIQNILPRLTVSFFEAFFGLDYLQGPQLSKITK